MFDVAGFMFVEVFNAGKQMNKNKRYQCLVYSDKKTKESVLIWSGNQTPAQVAARQDIPFGKIYATAQIAYDVKKNRWKILDLNPLFNSCYRLNEDEQLIFQKIAELEKIETTQSMEALKKRRDR